MVIAIAITNIFLLVLIYLLDENGKKSLYLKQ